VAKIGKIDQKCDFLIFFSKVFFLNALNLGSFYSFWIPWAVPHLHLGSYGDRVTKATHVSANSGVLVGSGRPNRFPFLIQGSHLVGCLLAPKAREHYVPTLDLCSVNPMSRLVLLKQISYVPTFGTKQISYVHYYTVVDSKRYVAFCRSSKILNCLPVLGRCYSVAVRGRL
jgi:hypothetical protein